MNQWLHYFIKAKYSILPPLQGDDMAVNVKIACPPIPLIQPNFTNF